LILLLSVKTTILAGKHQYHLFYAGAPQHDLCVFEIGHINSHYSVSFIKSYLLSLWFWSEKLLKR